MSKQGKKFALSEDIVIDSESDDSHSDLGVQVLPQSAQTAAVSNIQVQPRDEALLHISDSDSSETSDEAVVQNGAKVIKVSLEDQINGKVQPQELNAANIGNGRNSMTFTGPKSSSHNSSSYHSANTSHTDSVQNQSDDIDQVGHEAESGDVLETLSRNDLRSSTASSVQSTSSTIPKSSISK